MNRDHGNNALTRLYVGGINDQVKREHLEDLFSKYGKCAHVWVAFNPPGFAFINYEDEKSAQKAVDEMNGGDFMGCKLRVELSKPRGARGGGRGGRGGYGGRGGGRGSSNYGDGGRFRGGGGRGGGYYDGGNRSYGSGNDSYGGGGSRGGYRRGNRSSNEGTRRYDDYGSSNRNSGTVRSSGGTTYGNSSRFRSRSPVGRSSGYGGGGIGGSYSRSTQDSYYSGGSY